MRLKFTWRVLWGIGVCDVRGRNRSFFWVMWCKIVGLLSSYMIVLFCCCII